MEREIFRSASYLALVDKAALVDIIPWRDIDGKTVLVTGASGMIGSHLIDVMLRRNCDGANIKIVVVGRNAERLKLRFGDGVSCVAWDMHNDSPSSFGCRPDYIIHLASNTHPNAYVDDAVGTIMMNVVATKALLDFAVGSGARFVYASSVEIYGKNRGDVELFDENYCGYIDCNTLRAGYPESKRCGEALCQAYQRNYGVEFVIPRIARCYGPTLRPDDSKALSQFLNNALKYEDIVLKSEGLQYFSYIHVSDAVTGILLAMLKGATGEAYNLADESSDIRLRDLAAIVSRFVGRKVVFQLPDVHERSGFSVANIARMDGSKIKHLGWKPMYDITSGIKDTLMIMSQEERE